MQYSDQRQSGSAIVYVIVGVLLVAASIGAIIVAQNRGGQQIATRPVTEAPQGTDNSSDSQGADNQQKTSEQQQKEKDQQEQDKKAAAEKQRLADEKAKADADAKRAADEKAAADKAAAEQQATATAGGPMARTGASQSASHLPTTGPVEDTLSMVVGLVALLGAGYGYYHFGVRRG